MQYEQAVNYIYKRQLFGMKLGLKNITEIMTNLKTPQDKFKSIHIAGTNGKGSTSAFIASILEKQGYKVGVYTSPHLVDFRERIKVNGKKISKNSLTSILERIKPKIKDHTFFEVVTAIAFIYFAQQKIDFAIVEVGLGGRLDATNIITPEISAITNISLEHTEHLGKTINKIAAEKAGIIKQGIDVVISNKIAGLKVIEKICREKKCKLYKAKEKNVKIGLKGEFQKKNASLALKIIEVLRKKGYKISKQSENIGLRTAKWPGRFEYISKNLIFDCAHNPAGAKELAKEIKKLKKKKTYIILGIMKDKDIKGICKELVPVAKEIILTKAPIERAAMPEKIAEFIKKKDVTFLGINDALEYAKLKAGKDGLVVLTGSIFTVGAAFSLVRPKPFNT